MNVNSNNLNNLCLVKTSTSRERYLILGTNLCLILYYMYAYSEGSCKTLHLADVYARQAFAGCICNKYHYHMWWLICFNQTCIILPFSCFCREFLTPGAQNSVNIDAGTAESSFSNYW